MGDNKQPIVTSVRVKRLSGKQNFTQKFIGNATRDGYMSMSQGNIIIHAEDSDLTYKILRTPGYFCCHDNKPLGSQEEGRDYVKENFDGVESPDTNNPLGYRKDNFYACELQGEK